MENRMNRSIKILVGALLVVSAAHAEVSDTDRTFISTNRSRDRHIQASLAHALISTKADDRANGTLQVSPFFSQTTNGKRLGRALGLDGNDRFTVNNLAGAAATGVRADYFIHGAADDLSGAVGIKPQQHVYGAHLNYFQHLDGITEGLFLSIHAPLIHVKNDGKLTVDNDSVGNIENFFRGNYSNDTVGTKQDKLKNGKFAQGGHSKTGIADIEATLGWNFFQDDRSHAGINIAAIFPTGNRSSGEYAFEPLVGNHHWGIGAGFNADVTLWQENEHSLKLLLETDYRYLFEDTQKRVSNIVGNTTLQHYRNVGRITTAAVGAENRLQPFANVATLDYKIKPGSQIDALAAFSYSNTSVTLDLGYNLFFKQAEDGSLKSNDSWTDSTYAFVATNYDTSTDLTVDNAVKVLNRADLSAPLTPATLTHKLFAGIGYTIQETDYPVLLGLGGAYQFTDNKNTSATGFDVWGKIGISF